MLQRMVNCSCGLFKDRISQVSHLMAMRQRQQDWETFLVITAGHGRHSRLAQIPSPHRTCNTVGNLMEVLMNE